MLNEGKVVPLLRYVENFSVSTVASSVDDAAVVQLGPVAQYPNWKVLSHSWLLKAMLIASEPTPPGGDAGPVTNENVPVLLVGSNAHRPFGAMSPLPTT